MNNLTLIVDGNWLLMSKLFSFQKQLSTNPEKAGKALLNALVDATESVYNFLGCSNIIVVSDGGSWRKYIELPDHHNDAYKANRSKTSDIDWEFVYNIFNEYKTIMGSRGYTTSWGPKIEGDDWVWYWTNYLNSKGINGVIWSSDHDLRQLVRYDKSLICWFNSDLVLPEDMNPSDLLGAMMNPKPDPVAHIQANRVYINPADIVIGKILGGDAGDNIMSIIRYQKGSKTYKFSPTDIKKLREDIELKGPKDPYKKRKEIAKWIVENPKFKPYKFVKNHIEDMIKLNTQLVWLDKSSYPKEILENLHDTYKQGVLYEQPEIDFSFLD